MTTILYSHEEKTVYYDSQVSAGDTILSLDEDKKVVMGDLVFIFCGRVCDQEKIISEYLSNGDNYLPNVCHSSAAILVRKGEGCSILCLDDGKLVESPLKYSTAMGSGASFALGALDAGLTGQQAVKLAIGRDVYSGGKVRKVKW